MRDGHEVRRKQEPSASSCVVSGLFMTCPIFFSLTAVGVSDKDLERVGVVVCTLNERRPIDPRSRRCVELSEEETRNYNTSKT